MQGYKKRYLVLITSLLSALLITTAKQIADEASSQKVVLSKLPVKIGGWAAEKIGVEQGIKEILETDSVLMRRYYSGDNEIFLTIVYYQANRVELHLPERCIVGQGGLIVETGEEEIKSKQGSKVFSVNKILYKMGVNERIVLYFFESGDYFTNNYANLKWHMILNKLKHKINSGALIKFSIPVKDNRNDAMNKIKEFIGEITPVLPKYLL